MSGPGEGLVNLNSLSVPQLDQLNKQVEEEVEFFSESLQQLKAVQQKFVESREATEKLQTAAKGEEILVPLTQSVSNGLKFISNNLKFALIPTDVCSGQFG